jgi:hypothetical protein
VDRRRDVIALADPRAASAGLRAKELDEKMSPKLPKADSIVGAAGAPSPLIVRTAVMTSARVRPSLSRMRHTPSMAARRLSDVAELAMDQAA